MYRSVVLSIAFLCGLSYGEHYSVDKIANTGLLERHYVRTMIIAIAAMKHDDEIIMLI